MILKPEPPKDVAFMEGIFADVTITDGITAAVAILASILSGYNTFTQWRDRTPRIELQTYWLQPEDAPMAIRGTANPVAPAGKAIYRCEVTNVGMAGAKITRVTIFNPLGPPGKPVPLELPKGEQSRRLENGDSQTWSVENIATESPRIRELKRKYPPPPPPPGSRVRVTAFDTLGNSHDAKNPAPYPYDYYMSQLLDRE